MTFLPNILVFVMNEAVIEWQAMQTVGYIYKHVTGSVCGFTEVSSIMGAKSKRQEKIMPCPLHRHLA